jgi:hypothetical protein
VTSRSHSAYPTSQHAEAGAYSQEFLAVHRGLRTASLKVAKLLLDELNT